MTPTCLLPFPPAHYLSGCLSITSGDHLVFSGFPIVCLEIHFALCWALDYRPLQYGNTTFKSRKLTCTMLHFKHSFFLLSLFPFQNLFHDYWTFDLQGGKKILKYFFFPVFNLFNYFFLLSSKASIDFFSSCYFMFSCFLNSSPTPVYIFVGEGILF